MKYIILDDQSLCEYKVSPLRSQMDTRAGILKLRQKIESYLGIEDSYLVIANSLKDIYRERFPKKSINILPASDICLINSRLKIDEEVAEMIEKFPLNSLVRASDNTLVIAKFNNPTKLECCSSELLAMELNQCSVIDNTFELWSNVKELILNNASNIKADYLAFFYEKDNFFETEPGSTVINPYNVWIGENVELKHGAVIDASNGPVVIDENSIIGINSTIIGPAFIGKNSTIKAITTIHPGTSIGPNCLIGGEIENSILQGYTDKPYSGVLNNCFLGEWTKIEGGISIDSTFFNKDEITIIRDFTLSFHFNESSDKMICQYQEMRTNKLKAMKMEKNLKLSTLEDGLLKNYLNEEN